MFCSHTLYDHCVPNYIFSAFAFWHRSRSSYASIFTCGFEPTGNVVNDILSPGERSVSQIQKILPKYALLLRAV
jgi:hypothetical protein